MQCQNCYQETEKGKFCTNCGALISQDEPVVIQETAATEEIEIVAESTTSQEPTDPKQSNEIVEKLKASSINFGHFFLTLLKKPNDAKKANENDLISGIISIALFALLFAVGYFLVLNSIVSFFGSAPTFTDGFLWPFLKLLLLFVVINAITFAGLKFDGAEFSFAKTIAKYGGYLIPFLLLLVAGYILTLIGIVSLGIVAISISLLGTLIIIPTLILSEIPSTNIDRVYLLIIIYVLNTFALSFIMQSILLSLMGSPFGGLFS
ncbi:zinc ribbon domain-containing protein [Virgibacillus necropolis]|uniref:Zinc ribbon domain-containing protein n=1 Tax=Virgibacillus necropolis TaxID=163877 RepID=A0A221MHN3_9BACI|nr:zinc ribbon domain-containing protein [Virgibacillus necropolis]ASN07141.1 hypothetical protein CFK40_20115 [Virgibacillus necropolis]